MAYTWMFGNHRISPATWAVLMGIEKTNCVNDLNDAAQGRGLSIRITTQSSGIDVEKIQDVIDLYDSNLKSYKAV